jgi:hypothetical protein
MAEQAMSKDSEIAIRRSQPRRDNSQRCFTEMIMSTPHRDSRSDFWSDIYRGIPIAAYRHSMGWLVYIDHVMQANRTFAELEDATRWLRRKVDDAAIESPIARLGIRRGGRPRKPLLAAA